MILNDIILHDSQEFAAALALQEAQSKKKGDRKKEGRKKEDRKNANGKNKVISDDTE